ncbi:MAG: hypothetical protein LBR16_00900 [Treponema sp.]|jgi:hypothetical protein|nr:hypothetical protein [Treponema sp.]
MCWYCGAPVTETEPIGRSWRCACGKDLRCCRNCALFRGTGCAEGQADFTGETERATFCDWFALNPALRKPGAGQQDALANARAAKAALAKLFG